ncbi:MAG: acyl carrier protein [Planctomycetota bacterium]
MRSELLAFVQTELIGGKDGESLSVEDDLLTDELIDSMGVMRLIAFIEETYHCKIPVQEVTIENFVSVDAICRYLEKSDSEG